MRHEADLTDDVELFYRRERALADACRERIRALDPGPIYEWEPAWPEHKKHAAYQRRMARLMKQKERGA